ncbi:dCTP deaminase [Paenibacillus enshidis]|uniref:dCTP deaminase n=1 Tax=Paenibacillus enshidis TaxID=1458439 RepID=UPI0035CA045A
MKVSLLILTGPEIERQVLNNRIHIRPFIKEHINPNSYNYRLGPKLLEITDDVIDPARKVSYNEISLNADGYVLMPKRLYLGSTVEEIGSDHYVTQLIGRSSVGRLGLFLQITASLGHIGSKHCWTLELKCVQPVKVYPDMKIGQVSFWNIEGENSESYLGKYQNFNSPHVSEFFNEMVQK